MLVEHISAANRRGRAGARSRKRGLHHRYGGQAGRTRNAHLAANLAAANVRIEHAKEVRGKHLRRLREALRQGGATLQSMLIMSERLGGKVFVSKIHLGFFEKTTKCFHLPNSSGGVDT